MELLIDGSPTAPLTFAFAHGAGGPMKSAFMQSVAVGLAAKNVRVARFEFAYMAVGKKVPDREPVLLETWREVIKELGGPAKLVIGGKSMGGRMASMVADKAGVQGLVCLGYPFHPPGRPEKVRTAHLATLTTPTLIVQGTRDAFGTPADVDGYTLSPAIQMHWVVDGDHSLKPRASAGSAADALSQVIEVVASFIHARTGGGSR